MLKCAWPTDRVDHKSQIETYLRNLECVELAGTIVQQFFLFPGHRPFFCNFLNNHINTPMSVPPCFPFP